MREWYVCCFCNWSTSESEIWFKHLDKHTVKEVLFLKKLIELEVEREFCYELALREWREKNG